MRFTTATVALSSAAMFLSSTNAQNSSIVDIVVGSDVHTTLETLVIQAGLVDALNGEGPLTLFGPTDDAFAALAGAADKFTTADYSEHLVDILLFHVTQRGITSSELSLGAVPMANGGEANITSLDPPMINTANIVEPFDVNATNGVVHSIDAVLLPTFVTSDIVDIAAGAPDFSTLVELVTSAGLVDTLKGEGPLTVFAPTNAAFADLPQATIDALKTPEERDTLIDILTYHVSLGNIYSSALADGNITMANNDTAEINVGPPPMINDAGIVGNQILASNGVIHIIDKVILPPTDATPTPAPVAATTPTTTPPAPTAPTTTPPAPTAPTTTPPAPTAPTTTPPAPTAPTTTPPAPTAPTTAPPTDDTSASSVVVTSFAIAVLSFATFFLCKY